MCSFIVLSHCHSCNELQNDEAESAEIIAYVERISLKENLLLLRWHDGSIISLKIDKKISELKKVKKGDRMIVRRTDSVFILIRDDETPSN